MNGQADFLRALFGGGNGAPAAQNAQAAAAAQQFAAAMHVDADGWQIPPEGWGAAPAPGAAPPEPPDDAASKGPPRARADAIARLPVVKVSAEDLLAESACQVCMEDFAEGEPVVKLPCQHFFHRACVVGWLERHCTCPVCRLELPTDDAAYERGREARMRERKPRVRERELGRKGVKELRELMRMVGVPWAGCLEKADMVARLKASGRVDVVEEAPPESMTHAQIAALSVGGLKRLMASLGVSAVDCFERRDLEAALVASGKVVVEVGEVSDAARARAFSRAELEGLEISELRRLLCEAGKWAEAERHATDQAQLVAELVACGVGDGGEPAPAPAPEPAPAPAPEPAAPAAAGDAPDAMDLDGDLKPAAADSEGGAPPAL